MGETGTKNDTPNLLARLIRFSGILYYRLWVMHTDM